MKYMDWAAMGMASGAYGAASSAQVISANAYAEAIRARTEVAALWEENQRLREDIDSQRYDREFQKWVEELIYQFSKIVKTISDSPGNPINDCADIASFLLIINKNKLNTAIVSGLENKEKFDEILMKARNLLNKLETTPQVQEYLRQKDAARLDQKSQTEKSRLRRLREQKERQLQKEQIVSASESLVKASAKEWEETMSLLKIGVIAATLILGAIIYSYVK